MRYSSNDALLLVPDVLDVSSNVPGTVSGCLHLSLEVVNVSVVL